MSQLPVAVGKVKLCPSCSHRIRRRRLTGGLAYVRSKWFASRNRIRAARRSGRTVAELAKEFRLSERHIYRLLATGSR